ncbi:MAG: hypothetical protein KatS3mg129_2693 [Leptospiraceae bacterium]|nr:MAG: hypothetical protein KatS3mg129_2693 [Leptospiraceae bacterium]
MGINIEDRKNRLKRVFLLLKENKDDIAVEELNEILEEISKEQLRFVDRSELKEILIEIREGFKRIDERFEMMEKRFQANDKAI